MIPHHGKPVSLIIGFIFHPKFRAGRQGIAIEQAGLRKRRERRRTVGIDELQYKGRTLEPGYGFTDFYLGIVWQNATANSTLSHGTSHSFQRNKLILHGIPVFAGHICHLPNAVLHQRTFVNGIFPFKTQLAAVFQNHAVQRRRGIGTVWNRAAGLHRSIGQQALTLINGYNRVVICAAGFQKAQNCLLISFQASKTGNLFRVRIHNHFFTAFVEMIAV